MAMLGRSLGSQRLVMHFIGQRVSIGRGMLVFVLVFLFLFVVLCVQGFLQLGKFGGLDKRFGHGFGGLGTYFRTGLRLFVLGLGQLFGERRNLRVRESRAIYDMRVGDDCRALRGIEFVEFVRGFMHRVGRSFRILGHGSGNFGAGFDSGRFMLSAKRC
jgi:hypothetical protein